MQPTALQAVLPAGDPTAVLRIGSGDKFAALGFQAARATTSLPVGEYVITLDAANPASSGAPYRITTDVDAVFVTAGPAAAGMRSLVAGLGREAAVSDPKDPWPPPLVSGAPLGGGSPTVNALQALLDASGGKGGDGPAPAIHAILIGIDGYADGPGRGDTIYRPLRGCVRDILDVECLLRDAGVPEDRVTRLIAPSAGGAGSELAVPPHAIPTYDNIIAAWQRVASSARPGDVVYIHYSGHGGRTATLFPDLKPNGLDESLAPCDVNLPIGRHLRDVEIAVLLHRMEQRGLLTTLVLDSCYAGSATRDDVQVRCGDSDDLHVRAGQSADNSAVAPRDELAVMARRLADTPRNVEDSWHVGPSDASSLTTVIAACRGHESSYEYSVDGKQRRGALTYFWLETLRQRGAAMTYRAAYQQTFARVQAVFREQSPVLLGAADRHVLGAATVSPPTSIAVLEAVGDQVLLAAGASGLVSIGTRLAVLPHELLPELVDLTVMPIVEVTSVQASRSRARLVEPGTPPRPITLGSHAVIVRQPPTLRRAVRCLGSASTAERAALAQLEDEIAADASQAIGLADGDGAHFQVAIEDARFLLLDPAGRPFPNLPAIRVTDDDAVRRTVQRLVHLARFQNVRELTNRDPSSPLAGKLELSLHASMGDRAGAALAARPVVRSESEFYLRIQNHSARALSLAIFDLAGDWSIAHVNRGAPLSLEAGTTVELRMTTSLPAGYDVASDVLKVIGTLEHVELDWLGLRPVDDAHESHARGVTLAAPPTHGWTEAQIGLEVRR